MPRTYLFIGGFNDGNRLPAPTGADEVEVERPGDSKNPPEKYFRQRFGTWDHLDIFVREGMDLPDILSALQNGYKPDRKKSTIPNSR